MWQRVQTSAEQAEELKEHQTDLKDVEMEPGITIKFEETSIRLGIMEQVWADGFDLSEAVNYCNGILKDKPVVASE